MNTPHARVDPYFQLPFEYWTAVERWYRTLPFPATAVLLIALTFTSDEFWLPEERGSDWYGISGDTIGRGLRDLLTAGLLKLNRMELVPTLQSKTGYMRKHWYRLAPPFDLARRGMGKRRQRFWEQDLQKVLDEVPF
jgi:hypothetical protein